MTNKNFELEEKEILKEIIQDGIIDYNNEKFTKYGQKVILKLNLNVFKFTPKEKDIISSFTMNWFDKNKNRLDILHEKYYQKNPLNYLKVGEIERELMKNLDFVNSIREKINAQKKYMCFKIVFTNIKRMKNLNDIYISENEGKPYKIAFVDYSKNEYLKWSLESFENFETKTFFKTSKAELRETKKLFKYEINKNQAHNLFQNYVGKNNEMKFCEEILR
ncbi:hypothetical protein [Tenacibaculum piscium]|uniref:hypothetical protein n=1 Tax=Tenacibaculum piscium TaxID=1458515 RepID=UPI001F15EA71|nr:hypothetical protein [Tenacibaculum piscium]